MSVQEVFNKIMEFDQEGVKRTVETELSNGTKIDVLLNEGLIGAMDEIGDRFSKGLLFVPEMLMAAQAMKGGLELLKPHLGDNNQASKGTVITGTVKGDLHDIGKNLVGMMLEGAGFTVIDLGVDVDSDKFLTAAKENNATIIALSALLTTTMPRMKEVVKLLVESGERDKIKVMIGGAPVSNQFSQEIGSDGYAEDAAAAVNLARQLLTS